MNKTLVILRGLPGSGKTTFAKELLLADRIYEADQYFYDEAGNYNFDISKLHQAHMHCQSMVELAMQSDLTRVVVSNTSTTDKELQPYIDLAEKYGYRICSVIVENRHGNKSVHNVPDETLEKMKNRFSIKL